MSGDAKGDPVFEGWAVVELMGHRRLGGYVREVTVAGHGLLRVEMPADDAGPALTQFYSPSALYCLTPASEEMALTVLRLSRPEPVSKWDLEEYRNRVSKQPSLPAATLCVECGRRPATCRELDSDDPPRVLCDECCGHDDGLCEPLSEPQAAAEASSPDSQADGHREPESDPAER